MSIEATRAAIRSPVEGPVGVRWAAPGELASPTTTIPAPEPAHGPTGAGTETVGQLVARRESFRAALEIAQAILAGQEPDAMWGPIARRARRLVHADAAIVRTPELDGGPLILRGVDPHRTGRRPVGVPLGEEPEAESACHAVYETGRSRILGDLRASAVIVPLGGRGRVLGVLMAVNGSDRPAFRPQDADLLRLFARQVALAVQQAQERRELQRLSVIEERERLARELHDDAIQSLYGITLDLASAAARAGDPVLRERMARLVWTVDGVIQDLRNHVYGLRSSVLAGRRLDAALRQLARDFEWQSGTTTVAEVETEAADRLHEHADDLLQIAREALSNVGRHAQAHNCLLHLGLHRAEAWLVVRDDGVGFDPRQVGAGGHGLRNFEERASRLGGRLAIESSPRGGTELRITIPLRPALSRPSRRGRQRPSGAHRRALEGPR